jgi:hypothetical protein
MNEEAMMKEHRPSRWARGASGCALGLLDRVLSGCDSLLDFDLPAH